MLFEKNSENLAGCVLEDAATDINRGRKDMKKKMTRLMAAMLALVMLAGCGSGTKKETTAGAETKVQETQAKIETEAGTQEQTQPKETESGKTAESGSTGDTRMVVDATGEEVEVPAHPQAIAVMPPVVPNMVYALQGYADNMIAITPSAYAGWEISIMKELAPELADVDTAVIASASEINMEELAAMKPDLVICWDTQTDQAAKLHSLGIPVVMLTAATDMDTLRSMITMLGDILNCQEQAAKMMAWYNEVEGYVNGKSDQVQALADEDRPRVLHFMYAEELNIYANGVNPYITDWVGGQNIKLEGASAETSSPTMEEILAYDPEIVFLSNFDNVTPEDLYNNRLEGQDWSNVSAVKNHKVYKVPCGLYRWAPPNTIEKPLYVLWQASVIQPEIFADVDMRAEIKDFFKEFFQYELTEEQIDFVLHTELNR